MSAPKELLGYDLSDSEDDLRVVCADCADEWGDEGGEPLYAGEEWGGMLPRCHRCGAQLDGLVEVES